MEFLRSNNEAFRLTSLLEESFGVSSVWTSNRICDISASYDTGRVCSGVLTSASQQADVSNRGYLDFTDFKRFVKSLKARPELDRLFKKMTGGEAGMRFAAFERFMREIQKVRRAHPSAAAGLAHMSAVDAG